MNIFKQVLVMLVVLHLVLNGSSYDLRCPGNVQRKYRIQSMCNGSLPDSYSCLLDQHTSTFRESCNELPSFVRPGQRYVINGFRTNSNCSSVTYQPIKLWSHEHSQCIYLSSVCNEIGLKLYEKGSTTEDNKCRCDHNNGFVFLKQPKNTCFCIPSSEDCTCFKIQCLPNTFLRSDYKCIPVTSTEDISQCKHLNIERNTSKENTSNNNTRETNGHFNVNDRKNKAFIVMTVLVITTVILVVIAGYLMVSEVWFCNITDVSSTKKDLTKSISERTIYSLIGQTCNFYHPPSSEDLRNTWQQTVDAFSGTDFTIRRPKIDLNGTSMYNCSQNAFIPDGPIMVCPNFQSATDILPLDNQQEYSTGIETSTFGEFQGRRPYTRQYGSSNNSIDAINHNRRISLVMNYSSSPNSAQSENQPEEFELTTIGTNNLQGWIPYTRQNGTSNNSIDAINHNRPISPVLNYSSSPNSAQSENQPEDYELTTIGTNNFQGWIPYTRQNGTSNNSVDAIKQDRPISPVLIFSSLTNSAQSENQPEDSELTTIGTNNISNEDSDYDKSWWRHEELLNGIPLKIKRPEIVL